MYQKNSLNFFSSSLLWSKAVQIIYRFHCDSHMLNGSMNIVCRLHQSDLLCFFLGEIGMSVIQNVGERAKEKHIGCERKCLNTKDWFSRLNAEPNKWLNTCICRVFTYKSVYICLTYRNFTLWTATATKQKKIHVYSMALCLCEWEKNAEIAQAEQQHRQQV